MRSALPKPVQFPLQFHPQIARLIAHEQSPRSSATAPIAGYNLSTFYRYFLAIYRSATIRYLFSEYPLPTESTDNRPALSGEWHDFGTEATGLENICYVLPTNLLFYR